MMTEKKRTILDLDGLAGQVAALTQLQSKATADPPSLKRWRASLDTLPPSILDKAFKGEL